MKLFSCQRKITIVKEEKLDHPICEGNVSDVNLFKTLSDFLPSSQVSCVSDTLNRLKRHQSNCQKAF